MSIKKFCLWSNCNETIDISQRYCNKHQTQYEAMKAERVRKYDKTIRLGRDKQYHSFYLSGEWETVKTYIHRKYKGLCLYSYYIDHAIVQADVVHHIVEIKDNWDMRLDISNLIPLSNEVHGKIGKLYKDKNKKQETQLLLRELLDRWNSEMKG